MSPGSSTFYRRPGLALLVGIAGFAASWFVLAVYDGIVGPPWLQQIVDLVVISAPAVIAVIVAVVVAAEGGFWRRILMLRWSDLVSGLGVGLIIRAFIEVLNPTTGTLLAGFGDPSLAGIVVLAIGAAVFTPIVEELYFRGLVAAAASDASARLGRVASAAVGIAVSTAGFVILHYIAAPIPPTWLALVGPAAVSVGCGILFLITGRLGGAIVAHVVYNTIGVALLVL